MPRLREVPRSEIESPEIQALYTRIFGSKEQDPTVQPGSLTGSPGNFWSVLALIPSLFKIWMERTRWMSSPERKINLKYTELGKTRAGWTRGCQFVFSQHCKAMRGIGFSEEQIRAIPEGSTAACFNEVEKLVLAYTDDLVLGLGRVPDARFDALRKHFSDVEILELTYCTLQYEMSSILCKALRVEYDDRPDPIVEIPAPNASGSRLVAPPTFAGPPTG
jgi:alkylhydroperoxidase family enzyme